MYVVHVCLCLRLNFVHCPVHTCTTIRALQSAVAGCGSKFEPFITTDLLQLIFTSLGHANRFVRETGFKVISAIVKCPGLSEATTTAHWPVVAENLARGLADNWSQVCTCTCMYNTVEFRVSALGRLNITRDFGPHGRALCFVYMYMCT